MRAVAVRSWIMSVARWRIGDVVVRREVIGLDLDGSAASQARVWFGYPVHVVHDSDEELVTYIGTGAEFGFVDGRWPTATGVSASVAQPGPLGGTWLPDGATPR